MLSGYPDAVAFAWSPCCPAPLSTPPLSIHHLYFPFTILKGYQWNPLSSLGCIDLLGGSRPLWSSQMGPFLFFSPTFFRLDLWQSVRNPTLLFLEELCWLGSPAAGRNTRQLTPACTKWSVKNWLHSNPACIFSREGKWGWVGTSQSPFCCYPGCLRLMQYSPPLQQPPKTILEWSC